MKNYSLPRLISLNILTLGFYELFWLVKTRNQIVATHGVAIPGAALLLIIRGLQILGLLGLVLVLFVAIPASNRQIDNLKRPSPQCFIEYANSSDAVRNGGPSTVSSVCQNAVDDYFNGADKSSRLLHFSLAYIVALFVLLPILLWLLLGKWLKAFSLGIERATAGVMSANSAFILLATAPPSIAMYAIQKALNKAHAFS